MSLETLKLTASVGFELAHSVRYSWDMIVKFVLRELGSEMLSSVTWYAGRGGAAEVARCVQEGGRTSGRRQHRGQRARPGRALPVRRGGRALHVRARARRHGSPARQNVLRLRRPAVVRQPAPYHYRHHSYQQR